MSISSEQPNSASEVDLESLLWERGSLNGSSFKALCKFAGRAIDNLALREVLEEISARIHAAGDRAQTRKLADQTRDAFSFVARQRAIEILCGRDSGEARAQAKWPQPEPALILEISGKFAASTLAALAASSPSGAAKPLKFCRCCSPRSRSSARRTRRIVTSFSPSKKPVRARSGRSMSCRTLQQDQRDSSSVWVT